MFALVNTVILILIFVPFVLFHGRWYLQRHKFPFPLAVWGGALFLISFFYIPWLDLQPLKHFGLDWLYDVGPPLLEFVFEKLALEKLFMATRIVSGLDLIFSPRGWLTFLLAAGPYSFFLVTVLGLLILFLAALASLFPGKRIVGIGLSSSSLLLLLYLFYRVPDIDALGERTFPNILAIAVPVMGAHLLWIGPFIMIVALLLLIVAGMTQHQTTAVSTPSEESEWNNSFGEW